MTIQALFIFCASLLIFVIPEVHSSGVLTIRLTGFQNPFGRTYDGTCCDPSPRDYGAMCADQCDYVMRLIVSGLGRANDHVFLFHRPLKYDSNNIVFENNDSNLILTVLYDRWPSDGQVKMNAFFYDYDDYDHTTTLVDWFETDLRHQEMPASAVTDGLGHFQEQTVTGNRQNDKTVLTFDWSALCHEDECRLSYSNEDSITMENDPNKGMLQGTQRRVNPFGDGFSGGQMSPFREVDNKVEYYDEYNNRNEDPTDGSISKLDNIFHNEDGAFMSTTLPTDNESHIRRFQRRRFKPRKNQDVPESVLKRRRDKIRALGRFKDTLTDRLRSEEEDEQQSPSLDFLKSEVEIRHDNTKTNHMETTQNENGEVQKNPKQWHNNPSLESEQIPSSFSVKQLKKHGKKQGTRKLKDNSQRGDSIFRRKDLLDTLNSYETSVEEQLKDVDVPDTVPDSSEQAEVDLRVQQPSSNTEPSPQCTKSLKNSAIRRKLALRKSLLRKKADTARANRNQKRRKETVHEDLYRQTLTKTSEKNMAPPAESDTNDNDKNSELQQSIQKHVIGKVPESSQKIPKRLPGKRPNFLRKKDGRRIRTNLSPKSKLTLPENSGKPETFTPKSLTSSPQASNRQLDAEADHENSIPLDVSKTRTRKKIKKFKPAPKSEMRPVPSLSDQIEEESPSNMKSALTNEATPVPMDWWSIFTKGPDNTLVPKWTENATFKTGHVTFPPKRPSLVDVKADSSESSSSKDAITSKPVESRHKTTVKEEAIFNSTPPSTSIKALVKQTRHSQRRKFKALRRRQQKKTKAVANTDSKSQPEPKDEIKLKRFDGKNHFPPTAMTTTPKAEFLSSELTASVTGPLTYVTPKPKEEKLVKSKKGRKKATKSGKGLSSSSFSEKNPATREEDYKKRQKTRNGILRNTWIKRKNNVAVMDNIKAETHLQTSIPKIVTTTTATTKKPMASPQTSKKATSNQVTRGFDRSKKEMATQPPKVSATKVVKGLSAATQTEIPNHPNFGRMEENERQDSTNNVNMDSESAEVTGRWWSIFTVSPDKTLVPSWTKDTKPGWKETFTRPTTPEKRKPKYTSQSPKLAESPPSSTRRPERKKARRKSSRKNINKAILDPFRPKSVSKATIQRTKQGNTPLVKNKMSKDSSNLKEEKVPDIHPFEKVVKDNMKQINKEKDNHKTKDNNYLYTKNKSPDSRVLKPIQYTLISTTQPTDTQTERLVGESTSEMMQSEDVTEKYVKTPKPKRKRYKQKLKYVPSNGELVRKSIKRLKEFRSQTAAPGHWFVTAQRPYRKVKNRPAPLKPAKPTSRVQLDSKQTPRPSDTKARLDDTLVPKSKVDFFSKETPPSRVKDEYVHLPADSKEDFRNILKKNEVLSSHRPSLTTKPVMPKIPYNRRQINSRKNEERSKRKQAVIKHVKDVTEDKSLPPVQDIKKSIFIPTLQTDTKDTKVTEKVSNVNKDDPLGSKNSNVLMSEEKIKPYHSQQLNKKDATHNSKTVKYPQGKPDVQMDSTSSTLYKESKIVEEEEEDQENKNVQFKLITRKPIRIQRLDELTEDEADKVHKQYAPRQSNTQPRGRNAYSRGGIAPRTNKLGNTEDISFDRISKTTRPYVTAPKSVYSDTKITNRKVKTETLWNKVKTGTQRPVDPVQFIKTTKTPEIIEEVSNKATKKVPQNVYDKSKRRENKDTMQTLPGRKEENSDLQKASLNISPNKIPNKKFPFRDTKKTTENFVFQSFTTRPREELSHKEVKDLHQGNKITTRYPFNSRAHLEPGTLVRKVVKETANNQNDRVKEKRTSFYDTRQRDKKIEQPNMKHPQKTQLTSEKYEIIETENENVNGGHEKFQKPETFSMKRENIIKDKKTKIEQTVNAKSYEATNNIKDYVDLDNGHKKQKIFQLDSFTHDGKSRAISEKNEESDRKKDLVDKTSKLPDWNKIQDPATDLLKKSDDWKDGNVNKDILKPNIRLAKEQNPALKKKQGFFFDLVDRDFMRKVVKDDLADDSQTSSRDFETSVSPPSQHTTLPARAISSTKSFVQKDVKKIVIPTVNSKGKFVTATPSAKRLTTETILQVDHKANGMSTGSLLRKLEKSNTPTMKSREIERLNKIAYKESNAQSTDQMVKQDYHIEKKPSSDTFADITTTSKSYDHNRLKSSQEKKVEDDPKLSLKPRKPTRKIPVVEKEITTINPPDLKTPAKTHSSETQNKTVRDPFDLMSLFRANTNLIYSIKSMKTQQEQDLSDTTILFVSKPSYVKKNLTKDLTTRSSLISAKEQNTAVSVKEQTTASSANEKATTTSRLPLDSSTTATDSSPVLNYRIESVKENALNDEEQRKDSQRNINLEADKRETQVTTTVATTTKPKTAAKITNRIPPKQTTKKFSSKDNHPETTTTTKSTTQEPTTKTTKAPISTTLRIEPSTTEIKLSSVHTKTTENLPLLTTTVTPEPEKSAITSVTTPSIPSTKSTKVVTPEETTSPPTTPSTTTSSTASTTTTDQQTTTEETTTIHLTTVPNTEMPKKNIQNHSATVVIKLSSSTKEMSEDSAKTTPTVRVITKKPTESPPIFPSNKKALPPMTNNAGKYDYLLGMKPALYVPKEYEINVKTSFKNSIPHNPKAYNSIRLLLPDERTLPANGFVLHTLPSKSILSKTTNHPFFVHRRPKLSRNHSKVNVQRKINLDKLRHYIKGIRYGPTVHVPLQGLYTPFPNDDFNNDSLSLAKLPNPGKRLGTPDDSISDVGTVFTRYWPAVLGVIIGTIFLLTALLTSLYCRQRRLLVQRARWVDSPQHVTEPPDTSEYATSSAASLTSDLTRSSINLM